MHTTKIQVRFNDADALGHINNSVYFNYFDLGKTDYFSMLHGKNYFLEPIEIIVAHVDADFVEAAFMHEQLAVQSEITKIGNKSIALYQQVIDLKTNAVKCRCNTVMVGFDFANKCTIPISQKWRNAIEKENNKKQTI